MSMTASVKERPIIFSSPMVNAILDGRKTQTRRILKPSKKSKMNLLPDDVWQADLDEPGIAYLNDFSGRLEIPCPYGVPGDRLWVRESWCLKEARYGPGTPDDCWYAADGQYVRRVDGDGFQVFRKDGTEASPWVPSIHMPRWASRLTLEIADVRVERLQTITEDDAKAEGLEPKPGTYTADFALHGYVDAFAELWEKLNGPRGFGWDANPWVWVVSFRKLEAL